LIGLGETNKTLATAQRLYGELLNLGADRSTFILGFGGGIVTDVTGFVASTYMRGLSFGFVASTLLAQVDASVGGKNGVNFEGYKNMVGTFNQPDFVLCDLSLLDTLPEREFKSGLAEIIKSGLIADPELFKLFETHTLKEFRENRTLLLEAVHRAVRVKADIVERDEQEQGDRRKLNLGHTFAHAIEKSTREYLHGEAVAIGLVMIAALSVQQGTLTQEEADRVRAVVEKMGLPVQSGVELPQLLQALKLDKKKAAKSVNFVLMDGLGSCQIQPFTFEEIDRIRL
jgi:3-dehydroquinate synthase